VDALASMAGVAWEEKRQFKCLMTKVVIAGQPVLLVKPQTFMNLSGESVAPLVKYNNATSADLLVVQDDIDLAVGRLRVRKGGSCGGHNGVRNIIERLGTSDFTRLKIGVGKDKSNVVAHVLGKFDPETRKTMDLVVAEAVKAAIEIVQHGPDRAMNLFNGFNACAPVAKPV
jgi:peptidyl-tRNA hydrolase, PTH1 family